MAGDLAVTASATLVGAMATEGWDTARSEVVGVFGREGPERQSAVATQLDNNADLVAQAADPDQIRQALTKVWKMQWASLLRLHQEAQYEVEALVTRIREALPPEQQDWVQTSLEREEAIAARPKKEAVNVYPGGIAPGGFYRMGGGMGGMGMGGMGSRGDLDDPPR